MVETPLEIATLEQVADELASRPVAEYIFIYPDETKATGWAIRAGGDTLKIARTLNFFAGLALDYHASNPGK
jgi:hypothetical protein